MAFLEFFFFQAEDGIRDLVRSRGLGDVYKRQEHWIVLILYIIGAYLLVSLLVYFLQDIILFRPEKLSKEFQFDYENLKFQEYLIDVKPGVTCLLYTSDAADERSSVDLGGSRIIKKTKNKKKKKRNTVSPDTPAPRSIRRVKAPI